MGEDIRIEDLRDTGQDPGDLTLEQRVVAALESVEPDLTLRRAAVRASDGDRFWVETMPVVMDRFIQITPDVYWNLTVAEHFVLLEHCKGS